LKATRTIDLCHVPSKICEKISLILLEKVGRKKIPLISQKFKNISHKYVSEKIKKKKKKKKSHPNPTKKEEKNKQTKRNPKLL
jgi:hypothetical protein